MAWFIVSHLLVKSQAKRLSKSSRRGFLRIPTTTWKTLTDFLHWYQSLGIPSRASRAVEPVNLVASVPKECGEPWSWLSLVYFFRGKQPRKSNVLLLHIIPLLNPLWRVFNFKDPPPVSLLSSQYLEDVVSSSFALST